MTIALSTTETKAAYESLWNALSDLQNQCVAVQANTAGGAATQLLTFLGVANSAVFFRSLIAAYSQNQTFLNALISYANMMSPTTSMTAADFANANTAAGSLLTALATEYPHDGSGHLLDRTFSTSTGLSWVTATAAQAPNTMSAISAFLATLS